MEEQDYKAIALSRLTDRHRSDEAFISILDTLVDLKEVRQKEILQISENFLDIDKSEGKNLDLIGRLIGEERNLVNFIDRSYFGFLGARLSESYDIGYWYSLYKNKYGTLRTLSDEEYRRVLKARVVKNSSDVSRDSFLKVLNLLLDNESSVVIESENNKAIEVRIKDEDGLASYFLSKYKSDTNLIPIPLGRRLGVVHIMPVYYTSKPYPIVSVEKLSTELENTTSSSRPDPALVGVNIPTVVSVGTSIKIFDVIRDRTPKYDKAENIELSLNFDDVVSRKLLKFEVKENLDTTLSIQNVVSKPRIKTDMDEAINASLSINNVIREKI